MAFPHDPLETDVSILIDGQWEQVAAEVYTRSPISIERGRANEASAVAPSKATLVFNNRSGDWSPRNPRSSRYGKIGRNTPLRIALPGTVPFLALTGDPADFAATPDTAALDVVGDLDLRVEFTATRNGPATQNLIGKWDDTAGTQMSYLLQLSTTGQLRLRWSSDGAGTGAKSYTWPIPAELPRRVAVRAALDVDDGASGYIVRMYWAPSLAGPWARFDADVRGAGTTSVHAGTAPLSIAPTSPASVTPGVPLNGMVHAAEVYNSAGTLVASPDFTAHPVGTTTFADDTGKVWTLAGGAEITNRRFRLHAEVPSWSPRWDVSGQDIETPVEVAGIMRRLLQGDKALDSALRRSVPTSQGILAYWPMEESAGATQAYSPMAGVKPMKVTGMQFAQVDTLPSSSPLPTLKAPSSILATAPAPPAGSTGWCVTWLYRLDQAPAVERTYMGITGSGTVRRWAFTFAASISRIVGYDSESNEVVNQAVATSGDLFNQWVQVMFRARQSGGSVEWRIDWQDPGGDAGGFSATYTGTIGRCTGVTSPSAGFHADLDGMALGHIGIFSLYQPAAYAGAVTGYAPETALSRMARLTSEESNVPLSWVDGNNEQDSEWMGPQRPGKLMDLLQEAADADGGVLYENRDALALIYRDRGTFYNQTPGLVLDYAADGEVAPPLEPLDDDKDVRNDRTVSRLGGSSARAVVEDGPLSVHAPPLGVGTYDDSVTLNVFSDAQTERIANWRAHLGTWDEARYPSVHVNLAAAPHLIDHVLDLDIGDLIRINNLPEWMPPGPVDLLIQGYSEVIDQYAWDITFNCTPAGPWEVGIRDDANQGRRNTAGSALATAVDEDDTTLSVTTTAGPQWVDASVAYEFPLDVIVGGEAMTVTGITGLVQDVFARTVTSGWGIASSGQAWTTTGGAAADYAVQGA
ncbi:hypothetical protein [Streptomyces sp. NBC_01506]|uniref:hypothetical protein n=1 Tax=Streptomyces sp. NBC_01506 TaxID=2903887 RepID=UPI003863CF73